MCNPAAPGLTETLLRELQEGVQDSLSTDARVDILNPGIAAQLIADARPDNHQKLRATIAAIIGDTPIDIAIQKDTPAPFRMLIADMDSTMIEQECIDELAEFAGKRAEISEITERAMRGELDFEAALRERVAMLQGLNVSVLSETFQSRISFTPGARTLVQTMKTKGARAALVSGGFTFFTDKVAAHCGFDSHQANTLLTENDHLTGSVSDPILGRDAKREALLAISSDGGFSPTDAIAVGDGANDLAMLDEAGLGVAFHAKPKVAAAADVQINHGDLTALLYLQGIHIDEFVG